MKLYGAFAVAFAEVKRLWPEVEVLGVTPAAWKGTLAKTLTARIMAAKYGPLDCKNDHEWDAVGLADWAWERLRLMLRKPLTER